MRLYLISQDKNSDWDTFDSAVVAAETEDDARNMFPAFDPFESSDAGDYRWMWVEPEFVSVTYLGEYALDNGPCTVCSSFNAG